MFKCGKSLRRAAVLAAFSSAMLASSGIGAGSALADQYPPGSPYGTPYGQVPSNSVPGGTVATLTNPETGMVADDANNSMSAGTQMIQWPANGGDNQNWVFVPSTGANSGYDEIQDRQSGLCLDVSGASTAQDAPVIQWTCTGNANQQWKVQATQVSGVDFIQNKNSGGDLAVAGGESGTAPQGAGLVQDVDTTNFTDAWRVSPVSYRILTDWENLMGRGANPAGLYYYSSQYDATQWSCVSGYHFRMASAGTYNSSLNKWTTLPQAEIDQALSPETGVSSTDNQISTQQGPDGGWFPWLTYANGMDETNLAKAISWTHAEVVSSGSSGASDNDPAAANAGNGTVEITYGYTTAFQGQDLDGQVYLHCDPGS